ncbi:MAG: type I restriction enzyme HsdR N-terminal domain-containing protein [Saprospiraceae bacterium]|nr:type I restriction enzyme HsdR N-terminal domain-containing protein [Saprospiraceae bacterium]
MIEIDLLTRQGQLKVKTEAGNRLLLDPIRKKWLVIQPEELVRQLMILYLIEEKHYNKNRINIEMSLQVNELQKRCDVLVYDNEMEPFLLIECKAPSVNVNQATFRQIANYNLPLRVPYLLVTNGMVNYCCRMNYEEESFEFVNEVPAY